MVLGVVLLTSTSGSGAPEAPPPKTVGETPEVATVGLAISIARDEAGERVVDDSWVARQISDAEPFFTPLGVSFRWTIDHDLKSGHEAMHTRSDRDALTPLTERSGVIDVFVVRELEDVDEPGRFRMGVCWTGRQSKRFIILSKVARPTVLAHELGHFFGNHQHSTTVNNLMSYSRDGTATVFLDDTQKAIIRSYSRTFFAEGRLRDVGAARHLP